MRISFSFSTRSAGTLDSSSDNALKAVKAAHLDVFTNGEDAVFQHLVYGQLAALGCAGQQGFYVGGVLVDDGVRAGLDKGLELGVFGHKVGLGIDFYHNRYLAAVTYSGVGYALGGNAAGFLYGCGQSLFAQQINGLFHVALGFGQGLFAVHHAAAGLLPQGGYVFSGKIHSLSSCLLVEGSALKLPVRGSASDTSAQGGYPLEDPFPRFRGDGVLF